MVGSFDWNDESLRLIDCLIDNSASCIPFYFRGSNLLEDDLSLCFYSYLLVFGSASSLVILPQSFAGVISLILDGREASWKSF